MTLSVVWLKRDLRVDDHRPLAEAAARGPLIALYVYEPSLLATPEFDASHLVFINECLADLDRQLRARGVALTLRHGEAIDVLGDLHRSHRFDALWSHEETGNRVTYDRDLAVGRWCRAQGVAWTEFAQTGVVRRLANRDGWSRRWSKRMAEPVAVVPGRLHGPGGIGSDATTTAAMGTTSRQRRAPLSSGALLTPRLAGLGHSGKADAQRGGETRARATLEDFLSARGAAYQKGMSSPVTAFDACSRLSPYLAWGALSMRRVAQAAEARAGQVRVQRAASTGLDPRWGASLRAFQGRLRWHCHFMQKLEDEPRIEFENFSRVYDVLRDARHAEGGAALARFIAWQRGETGYPMVDACMRALHRCGWINFRMRAMLVSFASHHLWLHWRPTSVFLARHFLDFEPGIHFSQFQMQSGTTGINTVRIYSPAKQVLDHDPSGLFIRRELPELANVPQCWLAEPHRMPAHVQSAAGCLIGRDYPAPVVDHASAYREARERIAAVRASAGARREAEAIVARHGSRRAPSRRPSAKRSGSAGRTTAGGPAAASARQGVLWDDGAGVNDDGDR
jgi:deoxyribodipyrimidine photo-lyase